MNFSVVRFWGVRYVEADIMFEVWLQLSDKLLCRKLTAVLDDRGRLECEGLNNIICELFV